MKNLVRISELEKIMKSTKDTKIFIDNVYDLFNLSVLTLKGNKNHLTEDDLKKIKNENKIDLKNKFKQCYYVVWYKQHNWDLSDFDIIYDECVNIFLCNNIIAPNH